MDNNQYDSYDLETGEFIPASVPSTPLSRFEGMRSALKNYAVPAALGVADSLWNTGKSVGNLVMDPLSNLTGRDLRIPRSSIGQDLMPEGGSELARSIGDFGGNFIPIAGGMKALSMAPKFANNLGGAILGGAGLGYATGEDAPGGREVGAMIGAGLSPLSQIPKITNKGIGNQIVSDFKALKKDFSKQYNNIFKEAEKKGISTIKNPMNDAMVDSIMKAAPSKVSKGLKQFKDSPTLENAHKAQSDLGLYISKFKDKHGLTAVERNSLRAAEEAKDRLKMSINQSLQKGGMELRGRYQTIGNAYKKEVVPYIENDAIRKASLKPGAKGYIKPSRLPEKLSKQSSDAFMEIMGEKYPGYGLNRMLSQNKYMAAALGGAGAATLGGYGYNKLIDALSNR
jgi:hypothetical protein